MRLRRWLIGLTVTACLLAGALLPAVLGGAHRAALAGPSLTSLRYEEVRFSNGDIELAGMLFLPNDERPCPVAILIHGSGTSRRDNPWYLSITAPLQARGIAVLLPDKRGCERSGGSWVGAPIEDLAGDTLAAVDFVARQPRLGDCRIGLIGMSQGGWIAPVAAAREPRVSWVVSLSGSAVTTDEQLLHEEIHTISEYTWPFIARWLAPMTTRRLLQLDHIRPIAGFDPIPHWQRVRARVFFAFGDGDPNVPVADSVAVLRAALDDPLVRIYPDGGHAISDRETGRVQRELVEDLVDFILRR